MPTKAGGETIGERLRRLRSELETTRALISRAQKNGQAFDVGGTQVTEIQLEQAEAREKRLETQIRGLENRLQGGGSTGFALTQTRLA